LNLSSRDKEFGVEIRFRKSNLDLQEVSSSDPGSLKRAQEGDKVGFFLRREHQTETSFIEVDGVQKRLCRAVVEIGRAGGQTAKYGSLNFANVVKFAVDQRLPEIRRGS